MSGNSDYWVATDELGFVRNRMSRLPSSLWSSSHRDDLDDPLFGVTHNSVYACDALLPSYRETAADANPEDAERFKRLIREHLVVYARDATRARFLDKTHTYTVKLGYLNALLDGCDPFFLLVLRNPFTFCFRAVRRKPPSWRVVPPYAHQLRLAAEHWENSYRLALAEGKKTGRFAAVRFEDFISNPEATMRAVCEFVQLEFDRDLVPQPEHRIPFAMLPSDTKWHPLREDQWRDQVSESDAAVINERCQPLAASLGYYHRVDGLPTDHSVLVASSAQHMDLSVVA